MLFQSYSLQGKREDNEDTHFHFQNLNGKMKKKNKINFFGVFDGHGGKGVSKFLKKHLPHFFIKKNIQSTNKNIFSKYILNTYNLLQQELIKTHPKISQFSGSTACVCLLKQKKDSSYELWVINVGDSRCIMCSKKNEAVQLSFDHKPNVKLEKMRIEALGGNIYFDGYDWRVKDLSLSRAFGDMEATPYVTHLPFIHKYRVSKSDKFIILACDGLWDVLSNKKAISFVLKLLPHINKLNIAKLLAEYAIKIGSTDNVTIIILFL